MSNNYGENEESMTRLASMSTTTDDFRTIIGGISTRMNATQVAVLLAPLIAAINLVGADVTVRTTLGSTTILATDEAILCDCTDNSIAVNMISPTSAFVNGASKPYYITQKVDNGNSVTIVAASGELFYVAGSAQTSIVLTNGSSVQLITDGQDWIAIAS